jgi:hypothetical protein
MYWLAKKPHSREHRASSIKGLAMRTALEGSYKLVYRELPDGTIQSLPDVMGLMTYTKEFRNFNVYWKDAEGHSFSISYVASYKLTDKEYSEKSIYYMANDDINGDGLNYELSGLSGTSPVSVKDGHREFCLPLHDEPCVVFEGDKFIASKPGVFIDHWEKVA